MHERLLRLVLRLNAANSAVCGLLLIVFADSFAETLGTGYPGWVRLVGVALLAFAGLLLWIAAGDRDRLRSQTPAVIAGDAGWVVASIVTLLLGWFSGVGIALVIGMALVVDTFALLQWRAWRAVARGSGDARSDASAVGAAEPARR